MSILTAVTGSVLCEHVCLICIVCELQMLVDALLLFQGSIKSHMIAVNACT